jgi:hypothetical protein
MSDEEVKDQYELFFEEAVWVRKKQKIM